MSDLNFNEQQLSMMLRFAAARLGMKPEHLAAALKQNGLDGILGGLDEKTAAKVNALIGDEQKARDFINSPAAQQALDNTISGE